MIRRACWAFTRSMSIVPGVATARVTALFVISWNSARRKTAFGSARPEDLLKVPADRLALAVGVGGEIDRLGALRVRFRSAIVRSFPGRISYVGS